MAGAVHKVALALHPRGGCRHQAVDSSCVRRQVALVPSLPIRASLGVPQTPADFSMHRSFILRTAKVNARAATCTDALDLGQELVFRMTRLEVCKE